MTESRRAVVSRLWRRLVDDLADEVSTRLEARDAGRAVVGTVGDWVSTITADGLTWRVILAGDMAEIESSVWCGFLTIEMDLQGWQRRRRIGDGEWWVVPFDGEQLLDVDKFLDAAAERMTR